MSAADPLVSGGNEAALGAAHKFGYEEGLETARAMAVVVASELYDGAGEKTPEAQIALNVAMRIARLRDLADRRDFSGLASALNGARRRNDIDAADEDD